MKKNGQIEFPKIQLSKKLRLENFNPDSGFLLYVFSGDHAIKSFRRNERNYKAKPADIK